VNTIDTSTLHWKEVSDDWPGQVAPGAPAVRYKAFDIGSPLVPSGQLVEYEAGHVEAPHSHVESEIFFVVSGHLSVGDVALSPGTLLYISGGTTYGPSIAGPEGVQFLRLHIEN
jgi:hypothetical protein